MKLRNINSLLFLYIILEALCLPYASSTDSRSCPLPPQNTIIERNLNSGEEMQLRESNKSAMWKIQTSPGYNLTISFLPNMLQYKTGGCLNSNGTNVNIRIFRDDSNSYTKYVTCSDLQLPFNHIVSSNRIEIMYCNGTRDGWFQFKVVAAIAGYLPAYDRERTRKINFSNSPQWIVINGGNLPHLVITVSDIKVKKGSSGGCKRGYITAKDMNGNLLLPGNINSICNRGDMVIKNNYRINANVSSVNITFRNARFTVKYGTLPGRSAISTTTFSQLDLYTTYPTFLQNQRDNENLYKAIGLGCAGVVMIVVILLATLKIVRRQRRQKQRCTSTTSSKDNTIKDGHDVAISHSRQNGEEAISINNQMYERVIKGNIHTQNNGFPKREPASKLVVSKMDKKQQRLSQLAETYIDVNVSSRRSSDQKFYLDPSKPADACRNRPPIPLPNSQQSQSPKNNSYEYISSHLTQQDVIPPAYATVMETNVAMCSTNLPNRDYSQQDIPVAQYMSSESIDKNDVVAKQFLFQRECQEHESNPVFNQDAKIISNNSLIPQSLPERKHLSVTPSKNLYQSDKGTLDSCETPNKSYVQANSVSNEDIQMHFKKVVPRPPVKKYTISMPNLCEDEIHKPVLTSDNLLCEREPPEHSHNCLRARSKHSIEEITDATEGNEINTRRYNQPRPSAPDIFIPCAYSSGDDISQMRNRLEKIAAAAAAAVESSEPRHTINESSTSLGSSNNLPVLYDSPRPSCDGSHDSLLMPSRNGFYASPRPSLPAIFSDELNHLI